MHEHDPRTTVSKVTLHYVTGERWDLSDEAVKRLNRLSHDRGYTVKETLELLLCAAGWLVEMKK